MDARETAAGAKTAAAPMGGVSLQLAGTREKALDIMRAWSAPAIVVERALLEDDRRLIRLYSAAFALAGLTAIASLGLSGRPLVGWTVIWLCLVAAAAVFDTWENKGLAQILGAGADAIARGDLDVTIGRTRLLAHLKFGVLGLQAVALAGAIVTVVWRWLSVR